MTGKILKGPKVTEAEEIEKGLGQYFFETVREWGNNICQIDSQTDQMETFRQVKQRSVRVALHLQKTGIKKGDPIMLFCKNDLDQLVPFLAAAFLGAPVAALDERQDKFDIKYCIELIRPKVMFLVDEKVQVVQDILNDLGYDTEIIVVGANRSQISSMNDIVKHSVEEENKFEPVEVDVEKDPAFIVFSSGTTNLPKGVVWSHKTALHLGVYAKRDMEENPWKKSPMLRNTGFYYNTSVWNTATCIVNGIPIISKSSLDPAVLLATIQKYKVASLFFPAPIMCIVLNTPDDIITQYDISSLRVITVGGSPIDPEEVLKLRKKFPNVKVYKLYGSTETGTRLLSWVNNNDYYNTKVDSSGRLNQPGTKLKVVDVDTGELLGPNQQGEILVKSPFAMLGFYNREIPSDIFDNDGFLKTGDFGYYDEDDYVYVVDRINEIYKYNCQRVCPSLTENYLMKLPAIKEVVVVGVPNKFHEYCGGACIVLNEGYTISEEEIDKYISENLGKIYRLEAGVKFLDQIPKTPSGKFKRRAIRDMFFV